MAGVQIYMANTTEELVKKIELRRRSPFDQLTFVTQTTGIKHYLSLKLAERESVFCHSAFMTPNELMMDVARLLGNPNSSEFSTENMRWRIFTLLQDDEFKKQFPYVEEYYQEDELKRIQLATKLADLFDQYIVYRTDMMTDWLQNRFTLTDENNPDSYRENEEWQKWLWQRLKRDIGADYKDKAEYQRYLLEKLTDFSNDKSDLNRLAQKYSDIHVFGLTVLTKFHMELLWHLKSVCNVYFYFINPCVNDFWYDSLPEKDIVRKWWWHKDNEVLKEYSTGNELLTSWGKVVQELFTQLFTLDDEVFSYIDYEDPDSPDSYRDRDDQERNTLLQHIQYDIKNNIRPGELDLFPDEILCDKSIQVTSNYSKVREVEVLFDYLEDLIDNHYKGEIEPHDVIVMLPRVEEYVPYIRAVFDNAPRKIPYSIGDRSINSEQSVMTVALELLQVVSEEFTSESVLQLLDFHLIKEKYNIKDVNAIRRAVREVNVRYGVSGEKDLETHLVSWEQGLNKLIMGVFMRDISMEFEGEVHEPYADAEGAFVEELMSFVSFVRNLIFQSKITRGEKTLSRWNDYFVGLLDRLVFGEDDDLDNNRGEELIKLKKKLDVFNEIDQKLGQTRHSEEQSSMESRDKTANENETLRSALSDGVSGGISLSFESYLYILRTAYENEQVSDGYYRGRVTFCQALPMRSIPFKVVAFLGLNKHDFPRLDADYAFDLIKVMNEASGKKKLGDRITKDNDKYLFLEALLNARDFLYLSYVGRSIKDNKEKSRSGVLEELLDYIQNRTNVPEIKQLLITQHPLQAFSTDYRRKDSELFTYLSGDSKVDFQKKIQEKKGREQIQELDLKDLLRFYKHPIRYYMNTELGVYYNTDELLLNEEENFLIDNNLEKYFFKQELISGNVPDEERIKELKKQGRLPLLNMAEVELGQIEKQVMPVTNALEEFKKGKDNDEIKTVVGLKDLILAGEVEDVWNDTLLGVHISSAGKLKNTLFTEYLRWLFLRASGLELHARVVSLKDGKTVVHKIEKHHFSVEEAKEQLDKFVGYYLENKLKMVPFFPSVSADYEKIKPKDWRKRIEALSEFDLYLTNSLKEKLWDTEQALETAEYLMTDFNTVWEK